MSSKSGQKLAGRSGSMGDWDSIEAARDLDLEGEAESMECRDARRIRDAVTAILRQGEELLCSVSVEAYTRSVPAAFNASIGAHFRHCLDHFTSVLAGLGSDEVDYDRRQRDRRIETDPDFALEVARDLGARIGRVPLRDFALPLSVRCEVSYGHGSSPSARSSLGREVGYAVAHAIHHYALIAVLARLAGMTLPENFGVAPSTLANQNGAGLNP
jgi:hypothetical protein